jgi:hypothetical protein
LTLKGNSALGYTKLKNGAKAEAKELRKTGTE